MGITNNNSPAHEQHNEQSRSRMRAQSTFASNFIASRPCEEPARSAERSAHISCYDQGVMDLRTGGKGSASAPYEFAVKASIVTTNACAPGGQFVLNAKALPGNPYDGYTLRAAIEDTERLSGRKIERAYVDKGYRGQDVRNPHRIFISGQKGGVFGAIKRELRGRSAIEPVIGHMKAEGHLGRC